MKKMEKLLATTLLLAILWLVLPAPVHADMGPKPQIRVIVEHPPEGEYYLDLLVSEDRPYDNLRDSRAGYSPAKLALLETYKKDGWYPALAYGTGAPMWGKLTGTMEDNRSVHAFSYFGVPDRFKIIVVTPDNRVMVSGEMERTAFDYTVIYDYATGAVTHPSLAASYGAQSIKTYLATILIEGVILLLFRYSLKKNWIVFLAANTGTQILLTVVLGAVFIRNGSMAAILVAIPTEIAIIVIEAILYSKRLQPHRANRSAAYAIVANLASILAGLFLA